MMSRAISGLILVNLFLIIIAKVSQLPILKLADEFLLIISLCIIVYYILIDLVYFRISRIFLVLILYVIYHYLNYLHSPFELSWPLVLAQSVINLKVFLIALAAILVFSNGQYHQRSIALLLIVTIAIFIIGLVLNVALGEHWNTIFNQNIGYRYGYLRPTGFFGHPGQNAYFFSLTFVTLILLLGKKHILTIRGATSRFIIFSLIQMLITFPLTVRKGLMMIVPFGYFIFSIVSSRSKLILSIFIVFLTYVLWLLFKNTTIVEDTMRNLSNFTDSDHHYIRGLIIFHGLSLFAENFPFGVGGATFGTVLSQFNTLDVYAYVGLPTRYYDNDDTLTGVFDSGVASMLAEGGFIGMIFVIIFLVYFFRFNRNHLDWYNYQVFKIITGFTIIMSITEPVWQNGLYTSFYVVNLLFIYSKNNMYREDGRWV